MFQPNSQPFYPEAIAEELAQIGDEFNREFEYAQESFSAQEFLLLLNEVTQRRRFPDDSYEDSSRFGIIVKCSFLLSLCLGFTIAWFYCRKRQKIHWILFQIGSVCALESSLRTRVADLSKNGHRQRCEWVNRGVFLFTRCHSLTSLATSRRYIAVSPVSAFASG